MKEISKIAHNIDGQPMIKILEDVKKLEKEGKKFIHYRTNNSNRWWIYNTIK